MIWTVLKIAACTYVGLIVLLYIFQSRLVYFPTSKIEITPESLGLTFEEVWLETSDGVAIHGWYVPAEGDRPVVLICHGNAGNISHRVDLLALLAKRVEVGVFVFDYRGYGRSEGSPGEKGTYLDAEAAWRYLTETKSIPPGRIIVHGRSLGGAVAARLARHARPAGLILESSFTSIPDLGADIYWFLPVRAISRFKYATLEYVGGVDCPLLVVHSDDDEIVPVRHGRKLFEAASEPKQLIEISGDHNSGYAVSGAAYTGPLKAFVEACTAHPGE